MKIALIGYGNMGETIASLIEKGRVHKVISISYAPDKKKLDKEGIRKADVAIDFTSPELVVSTIEEVTKIGTNMVIGTTGWYSELPKVKKIVQERNIGILYGQNFSIGANLFFQIIAYASRLINNFSDYDVAGLEMHHTGKKDSPSGTARKLATIILENYKKKKELQTEKLNRQIKENELHFVSVRAGRYFGFHEIFFDSEADEIRLSHTAHNRQGFAKGAILAAEFIQDKKGIYSFEELFAKEVKV